MPEGVKIVPIAEHLIEGHHAALGVVAREQKYLAFLDAPPLDDVRAFVRANIECGNPMFVALAGDQVIGWCDIVRNQRPAYAHNGTLGMGLLPAWRGKGLGHKLIEQTIGAGWAAGLGRIELTVYAHNLRAKALYDKIGFRQEGVARAGVYLDGAFHDVIHMALVNEAAMASRAGGAK